MAQAANKLKLLRKELGRKSILDFAKLYFPHYMTSKSCSFHDEICDVLMNISEKRVSRLAIAAPRGYAKSTVVSFFYVMWSICYSKERCILILSATAPQAEQLLSSVSTALNANTLLHEDFPEVFSPETKARNQWTQEQIVTPNNIMVGARGVGQDFRGFKHDQYRPTLIILDDVDGNKNTYNADSRRNVFNWFTSTVLKIKDIQTANFVAVGTLLHMDSLLSRLTRKEEFPDWEKRIYKAVIQFSPRTDLWQTWVNILFNRGDAYHDAVGFDAANRFFQENKQAMLNGTKVLWEEVEDYYSLMKVKEIESSFSFDAEKQNDPTNAEECRYNPEEFTYWDDKYPNVEKLLESFGNDYCIIGACDPSVGTMKKGNDPSAIITLAKHKGKLYILDADIKFRPQDELVQAIVNFCKIRRPMSQFIIEANLFPGLLLKTVREKAYQENVLAPFKEERIMADKKLLVFGMETYITTGQILFSRSKHGVLLDQLKYFPLGDHDDGPDALGIAVREAELNQVGFLFLDEKKDRHGRDINDPNYGLTTPEEDAQDEDYDDGNTRIVDLSPPN